MYIHVYCLIKLCRKIKGTKRCYMYTICFKDAIKASPNLAPALKILFFNGEFLRIWKTLFGKKTLFF